jgi:hypothetical protein
MHLLVIPKHRTTCTVGKLKFKIFKNLFLYILFYVAFYHKFLLLSQNLSAVSTQQTLWPFPIHVKFKAASFLVLWVSCCSVWSLYIRTDNPVFWSFWFLLQPNHQYYHSKLYFLTGIFHWNNPSGRTMAMGSTQSLTEMSTRNNSWG